MTMSTLRAGPRALDPTELAGFRLMAAALAFFLPLGVAMVILVVAALIPTTDGGVRVWLLIGAFAAGLGTVVGPWAAWGSAAEVVATDGSLRRLVVRISARAVVAGAAVVSFGGVVASIPESLPVTTVFSVSTLGDAVLRPIAGGVAGFFFLFAWGLLIFGLPAFVVAVPLVAVWARLVRWLGRHHVAWRAR